MPSLESASTAPALMAGDHACLWEQVYMLENKVVVRECLGTVVGRVGKFNAIAAAFLCL